MKVCVPHEPNGASIISRSPEGAHPRCLVKIVFTDVSSRKTTCSGCSITAGIRCVNQSSRRRLTIARRRSMATNDFFICIAQLAQELSDSIGMRSHSGCIKQGSTLFRHRDVAILSYNLGKQSAMGIQLTFASRSTLRCGVRATFPSDSKRPPSTRGW